MARRYRLTLPCCLIAHLMTDGAGLIAAAKPSKPMPSNWTGERPRVMRRVPSLPMMPWQDDGR
jgi:hypothetical protein